MHLEKTYDMGNYAILENEYIPVIMKNKPRWMCCAMVATGLLMLMLFSVAVGVVIAYVHCYIEHRSDNTYGDPANEWNAVSNGRGFDIKPILREDHRPRAGYHRRRAQLYLLLQNENLKQNRRH
ncbi:PREDICTED: uncharacterized protein LOC106108511 isoform X2 [Papilio polytes]|uniref:uncharacterized protein LOC106108511 isoform X2 n=1 Tax=Papilio polytes TaxID=76194 RepID=UPI0006763169|nr:PREDICTED: uncharacterized protein LOC106108511 isoform X2 [Papilio polytes]